MSGIDILDVKVVSSNNKANQFTCTLAQDGDAEVDFEYLDRGHGAVIQVIHTGLSSDDITMVGQIKGVSAIKLTNLDIEDVAFPRQSKKGVASKWPSSVRRKVSFAFWFLSGLFFTCFGGSFVVMLAQNGWKLPNVEPPLSNVTVNNFLQTFIMGPMFLIMGLMLLFIAFTILSR
jgi:hypothetical protein